MLYSHDTQGLGHMRRNLLIASALMQSETPPVALLIAGAREIGTLDIPHGVDCLSLPAFGKRSDGQYQPRSLNVSLDNLVALRANTIRAAVETFEPDVFIVDKVPRGAFGELEPSLQWLRRRPQTRCVLGLREVLDAPATVRREWRRSANDAAVRELFHAVWVYGDPAVYDPVREYRFGADVAAKVHYTGYLDRLAGIELSATSIAQAKADLDLPPGRIALCLVGGGQDGFRLAQAFAQCELPSDMTGVIVAGPFMPVDARQRLQRIVDSHPRMRLLTFVEETAPLLYLADRVVAMGGYNTVCEVLAFEKPALIVPRVRPRAEQFIRAERLRDQGVLEMLHPDALAPAAIGAWLQRDASAPISVRARIDLGGLQRIPTLIDDMFASPNLEVRYAAR